MWNYLIQICPFFLNKSEKQKLWELQIQFTGNTEAVTCRKQNCRSDCVYYKLFVLIHENYTAMADKQKVDLGLLEEDDEFEEFPAENWGTEDADDEDVSVWEDNWEDDIVQDDFNQQLRQQLEKLKEQNKA